MSPHQSLRCIVNCLYNHTMTHGICREIPKDFGSSFSRNVMKTTKQSKHDVLEQYQSYKKVCVSLYTPEAVKWIIKKSHKKAFGEKLISLFICCLPKGLWEAQTIPWSAVAKLNFALHFYVMFEADRHHMNIALWTSPLHQRWQNWERWKEKWIILIDWLYFYKCLCL